MSTDDIVFDEVKYREPKRARRPDRDRRWACVAYEVPSADDLPIFLDRKPADAIERHALRDTSVELGGILLGLECVDDQTGQPFVWITESLEAKHYENTQASFTYTHDSWEEMTRQRDKLYPDLDIVGWYHTHPDFGIFLSSHDLFIHRNFFAQPLQLAYVVDPIRQTRGFFRWRDNALEQVGGFTLSADRNDRIALARLVNDLESIPNAENSGGGGLTPRLEAELIAMLSRPHHASASSATDRAQLAAMFGTLGLFAGVLIVAAAGWLFMLTKQLGEQTMTLAEMRKSSERTEEVQQLAIEALLAKENSGADPKTFVSDLTRSRKELETAQTEARREKRNAVQASLEVERLEKDLEKSLKDKSVAVVNFNELKRDLEDERARRLQKEEILNSLYKTETGSIAVKYQYAWWTALVGCGVALITSFGLLAIWASKTPMIDDRPPSPSPPPLQEPPHQIV